MCNGRSLNKAKNNKMTNLTTLPLDFTPSSKDILCGRGNVFSNHDGNRFFGTIIRANLRRYRDAANRPEKIRVVDDILQEIRSRGARFTKLDNATKRWYELNDVQAHQKIGHAIRDTIRLLKDKKNPSKVIAKQAKLASRKRRSHVLKIPEHVLPSNDTRKKTMDDILQMSLDTVGFLNDVWGEAEAFPPQPVCSEGPLVVKSDCLKLKCPKLSCTRNENPTGKKLFLKDEYPEDNFDFSPLSFFDDMRRSIRRHSSFISISTQ